jgi:hypothetical protein
MEEYATIENFLSVLKNINFQKEVKNEQNNWITWVNTWLRRFR